MSLDTIVSQHLQSLDSHSQPSALVAALAGLVAACGRFSEMEKGLIEKQATAHLVGLGLATKATVKQAFAANSPSTAIKSLWEEDAPWNEPVDLGQVLTQIEARIQEHMVMDADSITAVTLWTAYTYVCDRFTVSPYLAIMSPTKRCGKTTLVSMLEQLVRRPLPTANATPAVIFRAIEQWHPTLLMDEAETYVKGKDELRGILNSGHTRSTAFVLRTVGEDYVPTKFSTWTPKAFALIGKLPTTLEDRSVLIRLRRKLASDSVMRFSTHSPSAEALGLRRRLVRWSADCTIGMAGDPPEVPSGLNDRAADNWRPLLAIARDAGPEWLAKATAAALSTSLASEDDEDEATMLLHDLRSLFERMGPTLSTETIIGALIAMEERPWMDYRFGKALTARQLAQLLDGFEVKPKKIRTGPTTTVRGYHVEAFARAFASHLPGASAEAEHAELPVQPEETAEVKAAA